jgi:hypothetical protein
MNARQRRYYERGQRCDVVTDAHAGNFPAGSMGAGQAGIVKERLGQIAALDVKRASSSGKRQQGSAGRQSARGSLSELVEAVAGTAEVAAPDHPEMQGMFQRPRKDHTDQTLIATARSFAERAAPFVAVFVAYNLPATFVNDLLSRADLLESFISLQNEGVGASVNVNAAVEEHLRDMNKALERLNVIFHNTYRDNPSVLAEWKSAYHLEAAPGSRRKKKPDPPTDAPPPTPPPANT